MFGRMGQHGGPGNGPFGKEPGMKGASQGFGGPVRPMEAFGHPGVVPPMQQGPFEHQQAADFLLVERVKAYIIEFYRKMCENNVPDLRYLYYKEWTNLTNNYYKDTEWPSEQEVSHLVDDNEVFLLCYKELYYRHIFVHGSPLLHHKIESWGNYRMLFDMFLDGANTANMQLPLEWLGDMIDEFLYQFEDFCSYRHRLQTLSEEELEILERQPDIWNVHIVLGYLTSFIDRSGIIKMITSSKADEGQHITGLRLSISEGLGYYSLIGLCRAHCLLGDYRLALQSVSPIDLDDKRGLFTRIASTHITLFYYIGFAYMMMRRYADAVNMFSTILLSHRGSKGRTMCFSDGQIMSKYDKIRALCAISVALSPGIRTDEQVRQLIMEKYADVMPRLMQRRNESFEELFRYACPKFVTPSTPNYRDLQNRDKEAFALQLKWFLREVRTQQSLPEIRSYLKLYTSIPLPKLSKLCELDEDTFRERLLCIKYKSHQLVNDRNGTPALEGSRSCVNDVHFFINGEMLHVDESERLQKFSEYFMTHSLKFQQAIDELRSDSRRTRAKKRPERMQ